MDKNRKGMESAEGKTMGTGRGISGAAELVVATGIFFYDKNASIPGG